MKRAKRILFVCAANTHRSPTAEWLYAGVPHIEVRSAGLLPRAPCKVNEELLTWADAVFVMDQPLLDMLRSDFGDVLPGKELVCLAIPDDYQFMESRLQALLIEKLAPHLGQPEPAEGIAPYGGSPTPVNVCNRLLRDIAIRDLRANDSKSGSLMINSGTFSETSQAEDLVAFFPATNWRLLSDFELDLLSSTGVSLANSVLLLEFAAPVVAQARGRLLPLLAAWNSADENEMARRVIQVRDQLNIELQRHYGIACRKFGPADCAINRPGQRSTAFNFTTSDYMGLHIDTHENQGLLERDKSQLLCCVNLGSAPRFFHFINLGVRRLLDIVSDAASQSGLTARSLKNRFLIQFPAYPVIRASLAPGQAYICNAQNIIHDGATNTDGAPDIAFLVSGTFAFED